MKITLFSSNQPRHLHLARTLSQIGEEVFFISEANTVFPGRVEDFFKKSEVMKTYFEKVMSAEKKLFGEIDFLPENVRQLCVKTGDLNHLSRHQIEQALDADLYIVFGASYIRGWLIDFLIEKSAFNIHMGLSPYYRGSSCNFWALYDANPAYVGATIHMLGKGLDNGDMLFHCLPKWVAGDTAFDFTMRSVAAAHIGLCDAVKSGDIFTLPRIRQDKQQEIRYTKNRDFTDEVAWEFLQRDKNIFDKAFEYPALLNPHYH